MKWLKATKEPDRYVVVWYYHDEGEYTINDFDTEQEAKDYCLKEIEDEKQYYLDRMDNWYVDENRSNDGGYDKSWDYGNENTIGYVRMPGHIKDRKAVVEYAHFMITELHDIDIREDE